MDFWNMVRLAFRHALADGRFGHTFVIGIIVGFGLQALALLLQPSLSLINNYVNLYSVGGEVWVALGIFLTFLVQLGKGYRWISVDRQDKLAAIDAMMEKADLTSVQKRHLWMSLIEKEMNNANILGAASGERRLQDAKDLLEEAKEPEPPAGA